VTIFDQQCRARNLPPPIPEYWFATHIGRRFRFGWAWPDQKLAMDIGGYKADCEKFAEAAIMGWRVIRCLPEHVTKGVAVQWVERAMKGTDAP
jgi:hypothetical protein